MSFPKSRLLDLFPRLIDMNRHRELTGTVVESI